MRIVILTHEYAPFSGGVGRCVAEMARAATALGYEVTIHAPSYGREAQLDAEPDGSRVSRFPGGMFHLKRDFFQYTRAVRRFLRANPSDIVHIADWPAILVCGWDPSVRRMLRQRRTVVTLYGTDILNLARHRITAWMARRTLQMSARCAAISAYTANLYTQQFPTSPAPVVAHLGVSPFWRRSRRAEIRAAGARLPIVSVGRVVADKGHATVIEAIGQLPDDVRQRIDFHVVGSGPESYAAELTTLAQARQVHLVLHGRLSDDEVAQLYQTSWLHVLASRHHESRIEGFGLVLLEAALAGLPSIATRVGGITELVRHGETGFLVEQDNATQMSSILDRLAQNPGACEALGAAAAANAAAFTWERTAQLTYDLNEAIETRLHHGDTPAVRTVRR
jgi:glycosyltransferase involved in cell wall biosynthesis